MLTILVADDERSLREMLEIMLTEEGYEVITASTAEKAMDILDNGAIDLVISDIKMPGASGLEVLKKSIDLNPDVPVIMITAFGSADSAVEAMKDGAYDYITKPFKIEEIKLVVAKALERRRDKEELQRLKDEIALPYQFDEMVGKSDAMAQVFQMIQKVARSRSTVLITGESGTGKELVARAIHQHSSRKDKPFLSINCGAMPEQLLESELFGHQKGAFTSANSDKKGLLEVADGGSFLLDEIGEAPLTIQVKLLRFLQEREFKRVGGVRDIQVDVRIMAATNRNLPDLIEAGLFREDLYYRLNIIPIDIPPLRNRRDDIPLLVNRFVKKFSEFDGKKIKISPETMKLLENYSWKGNVRELENVIERAIVLSAGDTIYSENLPDEIIKASPSLDDSGWIPTEGIDLEASLQAMEKKYLTKALNRAKGKKKEAAKLLNLTFRSFRYKVLKYELDNDVKDKEDD